jgi:glycosyltransferase involved in cell wall biosynthesis
VPPGEGRAEPPTNAASLRVAIVHERFTELGGSERVVEQFHRIWPDAPVFVPIADRSVLPPGLRDAEIRTSALQRLYRRGDKYAPLLPLLPLAMAHFDLSGFDLVVTDHHAFANRVRPPNATPVISNTLTPARWMWERSMRKTEGLGSLALGAFAATQRGPDRRAADRLRGVIAISRHVADRVSRWWGRGSWVVSPPVDTTYHHPDTNVARDDFFLLAGRLVPYKRPDIAVAAAKRAGARLVVAGEGRARAQIESLAGPRTEFVGRVDDETLRDLYRRCRALLFPGEEDFGIIPVEAEACGTPVIAPALGGVLDTVVPGTTGVLYDPVPDPVETLAAALRAFDDTAFDRRAIRAHAERFAPDAFRERFVAVVDEILGGGSPPLGNTFASRPCRGTDSPV